MHSKNKKKTIENIVKDSRIISLFSVSFTKQARRRAGNGHEARLDEDDDVDDAVDLSCDAPLVVDAAVVECDVELFLAPAIATVAVDGEL